MRFVKLIVRDYATSSGRTGTIRIFAREPEQLLGMFHYKIEQTADTAYRICVMRENIEVLTFSNEALRDALPDLTKHIASFERIALPAQMLIRVLVAAIRYASNAWCKGKTVRPQIVVSGNTMQIDILHPVNRVSYQELSAVNLPAA